MTANVRFVLRQYLGKYPRAYLAFAGHKDAIRRRFVRDDTEIVIDGFPRSANTFAYHAFLFAQKGRVGHVGHHMHVAAQFIRARQLRVPAVLLLREPKDAVISLVVRNPRLSLVAGLRAYTAFHSALLGYQQAFVTARFEQVTTDFGRVVAKVNDRFGTHFEPFVHSSDNERNVFETIAQLDDVVGREDAAYRVAHPTARKAARKENLLHLLNEGENATWLEQAQDAFHAFG